ncbi:heme transporter HemC [Caulobacter sp. SLTY]|uniref:heme ABC transporter permease CcmC n=1 Tax=Caulobacter sp. SLTY TaxID=2683262 RepID=UPI0014131735|nr:heme ABC transporter permease CcmC [Caulobacter sp. SLTY]NBB13961.1 heme transporter HemC [Caulobacter sp. SLTY]
MVSFLTNPRSFMTFSRIAAPVLGVATAVAMAVGLWLGFTAPEDVLHGDTVRIMFIHVPAAWTAMFAYLCLAIASLLNLVFRQALADLAARALAPLGAGFTALALITGSLWGRPTWGTWWEWDGRMTSVLVLLLLYLGYIALRASIDDEARAGRAGAILAMVGIVNLPIIHWSVYWWNSLHQGSSTFEADKGDALPAAYGIPLALMGLAYLGLFGALWLVRIRTEVRRRRLRAAALRAAED